MSEGKFHRIRFYEKAWSTFDEIMPCEKPNPCIGCMYGHPFCSENGRVLPQKDDAQ